MLGLSVAGIYRLSGVKSKVELLKGRYNRNEEVDLSSQDPNNVASLLKQYLRELPEPILTKTLAPKLEETAGKWEEVNPITSSGAVQPIVAGIKLFLFVFVFSCIRFVLMRVDKAEWPLGLKAEKTQDDL